ncbi:fanconi-associated nuclease 1-like [Anthonomus grandis grandis]|uniref:fanconi-associated nuclease 1-like n=1 Tax=Anthonomus grandis grandis TaxID=2921223 RepID=UPI002165FB17|nr:fanconi-associated nuclease 1-like [Anthonomus grandis grandis]
MNTSHKGKSTKLKQMSITDSFMKAKLHNFKAQKTFNTSEYVICIDSDSDENDQNSNNNDSCDSILSDCSDKTISYEYETSMTDAYFTSFSTKESLSIEQDGKNMERLILNYLEDSQDSSQYVISESCSTSEIFRETDQDKVGKQHGFNSNTSKDKINSQAKDNIDIFQNDEKAMKDQIHKLQVMNKKDVTINLKEQKFVKNKGTKKINNSKQVITTKTLKNFKLSTDKQITQDLNQMSDVCTWQQKLFISALPRSRSAFNDTLQQSESFNIFNQSCSDNNVSTNISYCSSSTVTTKRKPQIFDIKEENQFQSRQLTEIKALFNMVIENKQLSNLLTRESEHIITQFLQMKETHQYVVIKLFIWKKIWYNVFKFCKKAQIVVDENRILDIFKFLSEIKFVLTDFKHSDSIDTLLKQLDRKQVKEIMHELKIASKKSTKDEMIKNIRKATTRQTTLSKVTLKDLVLNKIEKKMGLAVKLDDIVTDSFQNAFLLATFANPDLHKIEDFFKTIIYDRCIYPVTPLQDYLVFSSEDKFTAYAQALKISEKLEKCLTNQSKEDRNGDIHNLGLHIYNLLQSFDLNTTSEHSNAPHLKRFTAEHVYSNILTMCCEKIFTKQNGFPNTVKTWLEYLIRRFPHSTKIGKWYQLLIWLNMRHLEPISFETSAQLLIEAFESKGDLLGDRAKAELGELGQTLKCSKKFRISQIYINRIAQLIPLKIDPGIFPHNYIDSSCLRSNVLGKKRVYVTKEEGETTYKTVEDVALDYYKKNGFTGGEKCEGSLVRGLMILVFWDIIYEPQIAIPGSFVSKFQKAPLDFMTPYFFENRKEAINVRLKEIESGWPDETLENFATNTYIEHFDECSAYGVIHNMIRDVAIVKILFAVINRKVLAKIFERLIKNTREFSSGMPDLLIWDVEKQIHRFVEVKGEGDRLSISQKLWLTYLQEIGAYVEVCIVHSIGSKRKKPKKLQAEANISAQDVSE